MKNYKSFLFILSAALLIASCQVEMSNPLEGEGPVTERYFTCVFAPSDTKVNVSEQGKVTWEPGDQILVHGGQDGADRVLVTLSKGDIANDGKSARINIGDLQPYDRTDAGVVSGYYAQYPADAVSDGTMYYE